MKLPLIINPKHQHVFDTLNSPGHYYTVKGLAEQTGLPTSQIYSAFDSHPDLVRTSVIPSSSPLYTINTPMSGILDHVNAIRGMQFDKY